MAKVLSFDELAEDGGIEYAEVETSSGIVRLGTVSSADILEWFEENKDPELSKLAGLRLLVKSLVDENGARVGDGLNALNRRNAQNALVVKMARRDARKNGVLVKKALELNGLRAKSKDEEIARALKNDSSATDSGGSPSESRLPQDDSVPTQSSSD